MLGRGGGKCPLTQDSQGLIAQQTSDPCSQGEFAWMWCSVPCWLHVSLTSWIISLCSVPLCLSVFVSLSLQVCLFLPLTMSVYLCIDSGSLFSLHCLSPCLSWFRLPSRSLSVSVSPSPSLSPLCFLSAQCSSMRISTLPCRVFLLPSINLPACLPLSPLRISRSRSQSVHLRPSAWVSLLCGFVSLRLPAPPPSPGTRRTARACGSSLCGPARSSARGLFVRSSLLLHSPHPRIALQALLSLPSSQPRQAGPSLQPTMWKHAPPPRERQGTGRLRLDHPDDTMVGGGGRHEGDTPPPPLPPPSLRYRKAGKG